MRVEEFLEQSAKRYPDKIALVCQRRRLTYNEINRQADRLARALNSSGVRPGDRVAIYLESSVESVISIFAILKARAVFVPINATTKSEKLYGIVNDCGIILLIAHANKLGSIHDCWDHAPSLKHLIVAGSESGTEQVRDSRFLSMSDAVENSSAGGQFHHEEGIDADLAMILYTSGSTGKPKGVMLTHLNVISAAESITSYLQNVPNDIILSVLPLTHGYGLNQLLTTFMVGGTLVLEHSFLYPAVILRDMQQERVAGFALVPTIAALLLQLDLGKFDLSTLRYITNAAAAFPVEHIRRLRQSLPHVKIFSMYGQTECTRITYLSPDQIDNKPASVGRGMPNQEHCIVDEQGRPVGPGVVGELVVRGSHVMVGYWGLPEETSRKLRQGHFVGDKTLFTGDLFRMDEEGDLYFVSRKDDIIKVRGEKVSPREVEDVLYTLEGVVEAAVIGVQDPVFGQAIKAFIILQKGAQLTQQDVLRHCAGHLEDFMVPKYVEFRESLPKTSSGKIHKSELQSTLTGAQ